MNPLVEPKGSRSRLAWMAGAIAFVSLMLLGLAARAHATETIFWDNYKASPQTIGVANLDGTGGGTLNLANLAAPGTEVAVENPEGLAYDPANGRIYVANAKGENILWVNADGSGAGVLDTGTAPVGSPEGIAVDPKTQMVYWANDETAGTIGYASANGGGGGALNTTGATIEDPYKIALDTTNGRVYWISTENTPYTVSYANLDGTGGANVPTPAGEEVVNESAINVDPATNQLYVLGRNSNGVVGILALSTIGLGGSQIALEAPAYQEPYGMAFDPSLGRFYWANYGASEERTAAFGTTTPAGPPATIGIATAPVNGVQDPVIAKGPIGTGVPQVSANGAQLSCSQGSWQPDYPGSYVYAAPAGYAYQWSKNGVAIGGATSSSLTATESGSYSCAVTASNRSGTATQASTGHTVTIAPPPSPASLTLKSKAKKAVRVKAGKVAVVKVDLANAGGTASAAVKVCGKLTKKAKGGLVAPKCALVASVPAGTTVVAKLKVKARKTARGAYKFTVLLKGAVAKSIPAKIQVLAPKAR